MKRLALPLIDKMYIDESMMASEGKFLDYEKKPVLRKEKYVLPKFMSETGEVLFKMSVNIADIHKTKEVSNELNEVKIAYHLSQNSFNLIEFRFKEIGMLPISNRFLYSSYTSNVCYLRNGRVLGNDASMIGAELTEYCEEHKLPQNQIERAKAVGQITIAKFNNLEENE